jgi:predicted dinucleotide-binding enzyme
VWQRLGGDRAEHDDVGRVDRRADAAVGAASLDEAIETAVDLLARRHGLGADERGCAVQWQDQLVADREGAQQELSDGFESGEVLVVDLVEDLVEQAVGAVLESVEETIMQLGILGTGNVAQTLARRWSAAGHQITFGSRDPASKSALDAPVTSLAAAVADNDVVVNATPGAATLELVAGIGAAAFAGKVLVDVANASTPSFDLVYPNSSLAEKLQAALPAAKVVKTMNTAAMSVMTEPATLPPSSVFVSGDDAGAKAAVTSLLRDFGWPDGCIVDLGGIGSARGPEHYFLMFVALMQSLRTPGFNIRLVT